MKKLVLVLIAMLILTGCDTESDYLSDNKDDKEVNNTYTAEELQEKEEDAKTFIELFISDFNGDWFGPNMCYDRVVDEENAEVCWEKLYQIRTYQAELNSFTRQDDLLYSAVIIFRDELETEQLTFTYSMDEDEFGNQYMDATIAGGYINIQMSPAQVEVFMEFLFDYAGDIENYPNICTDHISPINEGLISTCEVYNNDVFTKYPNQFDITVVEELENKNQFTVIAKSASAEFNTQTVEVHLEYDGNQIYITYLGYLVYTNE